MLHLIVFSLLISRTLANICKDAIAHLLKEGILPPVAETGKSIAADAVTETAKSSSWGWPSLGTVVKITAKVGVGIGVGIWYPPAAPYALCAVDMVAAAVDAASGNYVAAGIQLAAMPLNFVGGVSGVSDAGKEMIEETVEDTLIESAKNAGKELSKEASKAIGQNTGKEIAKQGLTGNLKEAAIEGSKQASKAVTKQILKAQGKELSKGLAKGATKQIFEESQKNAMPSEMVKQLLKSGGEQSTQNTVKLVGYDAAKKVGTNLARLDIIEQHVVQKSLKYGAKQAIVETTKDQMGRQLLDLAIQYPSAETAKALLDFVTKWCL